MIRLSLLVFAGLAGVAAGQSVPVARADGTGHFQLWLAPVSGGPATLAALDLEFLPVDLAGIAQRDRLRPGLPQLSDGAPAAHVRLPDGGSLHLVRGAGQTALLHLRADGSLEVPLALPETAGPALAGTLAVASDASAALLVTPAAQGGRVWLASLAGLPPRLLSPAAAAAADPLSLRVSGSRAAFVAGGVLHVAKVAGAALAAPVALGAPGDVTLPELALSADGRSFAAITQAPGGLRQVQVVDPAIHAWQITSTAGQYDTPNLGSPFGPWLALAADGSQVAFRATIGAASEVFVRDVPQPVAPTQVTANANFTDTIDNVGVIGFIGPGVLQFMAGEKVGGGLAGQLGAADVYVATTLGGGNLAITNATATSGDLIAPFTVPGELEVVDLALDPSGTRMLLIVDPHGADFALLSAPLDGSAPPVELLPGLADAPELHPAGDGVLVVSRACLACPRQLQLLLPAGALMPLADLPDGLTLDRFTAGGGRAAFVAAAGPGLQLAARVQVATGAVDLPWPFAGALSSGLQLAPATGSLRLGVGGVAGPPLLFLQLDGPLAGKVLKVPAGDGLPLGG
jgi:hypothetical protein